LLEALNSPLDLGKGPVYEQIITQTHLDNVKALRDSGHLTLADNPNARNCASGKLRIAVAAPTDEQMSLAGLLKDEKIATVPSYVRISFGNDGSFVAPEVVAKGRSETMDRVNSSMVDQRLNEHPPQK